MNDEIKNDDVTATPADDATTPATDEVVVDGAEKVKADAEVSVDTDVVAEDAKPEGDAPAAAEAPVAE